MRVYFSLGCLADGLEKQANEQGLTFGSDENAKYWEICKASLIQIRFRLYLPDGQYRKLGQRMIDRMVKDLKLIDAKIDAEEGTKSCTTTQN